MTNNHKQQNISYKELVGDMEDRFAYMLHNDMYNGTHAAEFVVLEEMLCDIEYAADEDTWQEQEASNKVLVDFSKTLPSGESDRENGEGRMRRAAAPLPVPTTSYSPSDCSDKLPILTSIPPDVAPGLVNRGYPCNSSPMSASPGNAEIAPESSPKIQHGGSDGGVKNAFFGTWNTPDFVTLTGSLESAKTRAGRAQQCNPDAEPEPEIITLAGRGVIVHPSGSRIGVYYAYHISFEGYDVFIHHDENPKNDNPQIRVDYRAESVQKYGLYGAQAVLLDFLGQLGFTKLEERLSCIPLQIMIDEPVSAFTKLYLGDHDVGKACNFRINGKKKKWGKQIETFETGDKERIHLSIYDKRSEITKKYNGETAVKYDKTIEHIGKEWWDSNRPITRVEYTLGRAVLKALSINSLEDFQRRERAIVQYLTCNWFRLLKNPKVRGTENDAEIHPLWERVRLLFFQYFSCVEVPEVKWEKPARVSLDSERLGKQGMGCIKGVAAVGYGKQRTPASLRQVFHHIVDCYFRDEGDDMFEKYNHHVDLVQIAKGVEFRKEGGAVLESWESFDTPPTLRLRE